MVSYRSKPHTSVSPYQAKASTKEQKCSVDLSCKRYLVIAATQEHHTTNKHLLGVTNVTAATAKAKPGARKCAEGTPPKGSE